VEKASGSKRLDNIDQLIVRKKADLEYWKNSPWRRFDEEMPDPVPALEMELEHLDGLRKDIQEIEEKRYGPRGSHDNLARSALHQGSFRICHPSDDCTAFRRTESKALQDRQSQKAASQAAHLRQRAF